MRRRNAALELTLVTVCLMIALVAGSSWLALRWHRSWLLDEVRRGLLLSCDALESSLRHAMMRNHRDEIRTTVERITRQTRVRQVRLADHAGRIVISTRGEDQGKLLGQDAPACALCHATQGARPRAPLPSQARTVIEAGNLRAFTPILSEPGCITQICHVQQARSGVLGVIDISLPLDEVETDLSRSRVWFVGLSVTSVLLGAAVVWLLLARRFRRPMRDLLGGIRRVAAGDLNHRIVARSNDEFGELAQSFNTMTDRLSAAQQRLIQSERLISMGKLAAGVAHEINNPLTGILAYAEDLMAATAPSDPRRKDYEVIVNESLRCRQIVRSLLDFARQDVPAVAPSRAEELIERALGVVARLAAFRNILIQRRIEPGLPSLQVDRVQIEQVLLNLIINAQQAMPDGGTIVVGASRASGGNHVEFLVEDNGPGIPAEIRARAFEPFFSTKGGKTDGLGLAVCLGIVQRHSGTIEIDSQPGRGTIVRVALPATPQAASTGEGVKADG